LLLCVAGRAECKGRIYLEIHLYKNNQVDEQEASFALGGRQWVSRKDSTSLAVPDKLRPT
jgi:hypothetical protein